MGEATPVEGIMLCPGGERRKKALGVAGEWADIKESIRSETRGTNWASSPCHFSSASLRLEARVFGDPYPKMATSFNLNPCIITFDWVYEDLSKYNFLFMSKIQKIYIIIP